MRSVSPVTSEGVVMRLGLNFGYWGAGPATNVALAQEADRLGFHSVWTAEAYGSDAVVPLAWIAAQTQNINVGSAILQMPARTPAMTAMTATTLDLLSDGRFLLGLGLSGPQVVEGWHGEPYGKPLGKTREYVEIVRTILRREKPLEHAGEHYQIPYRGPDATGLGKPLKLIVHPKRADIPIYLAAIGPKNVALAAEIADGWLPIFFAPARFGVYRSALDEGFARAGGGKSLAGFDVAPTCTVIVTDDVDAGRNLIKPALALYIGGMGARGRNFYNDLACRYGYESAAKQIQDLYLDGKKQDAVAAVPDELVDEVALIGPRERIADRLGAWTDCGVTTLICGTGQPEALQVMAELVL
jgi:F420-dependent oxidoreductase-like protein